jgi:hypothetical protein
MTSTIRVAAVVLVALALWPDAALATEPEGHVLAMREPAATAGKTEAVSTAAASAAHGNVFAGMAGTWSGGGSISLTNDINERLRCRAHHTFHAGNNSLVLNIRCASDNYKFELASNVVERRGRISGKWSEATYKASGTISGRVAGNHIVAVAQSDSLTTDLSVTTNGNRQTIIITPERTYVIKVQITLARR